MKIVSLLAALVALAIGATLSAKQHYKTKSADGAFVECQKKILALIFNIFQIDTNMEYYNLGFEYDIEGNAKNYTDKNVVEEFMTLFRSGSLPKYHEFSIFYEKQRDEAVILFKLLYFAKDFETFYKTACWARVHLNEGLFAYSYYIAVMQRPDTKEFLFPAPYEIHPELFMNRELVTKIVRFEDQGGFQFPEIAKKFGLVKENNNLIFYANYSNGLTYPNQEERISYFTEDIGWNSFYYYYHTTEPFWWNTGRYGRLTDRRGELYFHFYQKILSRYYMERLSNGLGEIPSFSWYAPFRVGYFPMVGSWYYNFAQRNNYNNLHSDNNYESIRFLDRFEKTFSRYLQKGHFKTFEHQYDMRDPKAMNFVGNYWQTNADLYGENFTIGYQQSYEMTARHVLSGAPAPINKYDFMPSALDFYQTSLRDPAFYQLYKKIMDYILQYKQYLKPYTHKDLHYTGVQIQDVKVDRLVTYFELYDFDAINMVVFSKDEDKRNYTDLKLRQLRINQKAFTISIDIISDQSTDAIFKIWIGPKYDSNGYPIDIEHNWMNFYELDVFNHKLKKGMNKIERSSQEFFFLKEDALPLSEVWELLQQDKMPAYTVENFDEMPRRLMLPKGTKSGFPIQFFVFVFPQKSVAKKPETMVELFDSMLGNKPFGYPLDRPAKKQYFKQRNMFFKDAYIYHEGEERPYANPEYKQEL